MNTLKVTIDRFEGNYAVCEKESGTMINIEKSKLPSQAKEGDILIINDEVIEIDISETKKRKHIIERLMDMLWE